MMLVGMTQTQTVKVNFNSQLALWLQAYSYKTLNFTVIAPNSYHVLYETLM